jgi:hypothetical protein
MKKSKRTYTKKEVKELFDAYRIYRNTHTGLSIYDSERWFVDYIKTLQ